MEYKNTLVAETTKSGLVVLILVLMEYKNTYDDPNPDVDIPES